MVRAKGLRKGDLNQAELAQYDRAFVSQSEVDDGGVIYISVPCLGWRVVRVL